MVRPPARVGAASCASRHCPRPDWTGGDWKWAVIQTFASPTGIEVVPINLTVAAEIERAVSAFAPAPTDGMIVVVGTLSIVQRKVIVALAMRHRLPTVYFNRIFVEAGGLVSYGPDFIDNYRRAASYVDQSLRVRGLLTYQCRHRPSTNWQSISKPRRQWASQFLRRYLPALMMLSNKGVMSASGTKRTFVFAPRMSAIGVKRTLFCTANVR